MSENLVINASKDTDFDSPDAEPRRDKLSTKNPSLKAAWYDYLYIGYSIAIYIADVVTDMLVSVKYFRNGDYIWFSLTLFCVFGASLVMMMFSLKWFYEDTAEEVSKSKTVVLHVLQLGPIKRYWDCYKNGKRSRKEDADGKYYNIYMEQWRDITMLRLFEVFIESAPQLVLQLYILAYNRHFDEEEDWLTACSACFSLISLASSIVSYSKALRDASNDKGKMTWWAFGCQIVWRLTMVASRIVTLVLFASVYKTWILLVIGLHWIATTLWIRYLKTTFCSDNRILKFMYPVVIGFIYIFCFFNVKDGSTRIRLVVFYFLMGVENFALMGAWLPYRHEYGVVFLAALGMVFGGYFIGVVALVLYYQFYHPSLLRQGICMRTSHEVPRMEGFAYRMLCCGKCCQIRSYEDEEHSPPRGTPLHIDIPASRGSLRRDVVRGEHTSISSPPFEREFYFHKPSQLQKQHSLDKEKIKKEKAERARRRHSMESGVGKGDIKSVIVQAHDSVPVMNGTVSRPSSLPKGFQEIQLQNIEGRNDNGLVHYVDVHKPNDTRFNNGTVPHPSSPSCSNFEVNQVTNIEVRNENGMVHSVDIHKARITHISNGCDPVVENSSTTSNMDPEDRLDMNHNTSPVFQNDRQEIGSSVVIGGTGNDEVHRGQDDAKETRTSCDDEVYCGTDDEQNTKTSCDDGVHCGTDDEKESKNSSKAQCDKELLYGNDHVDDECTVRDSHVKKTRNHAAPFTPLRKYSDSANFHHRYSIVSDCISLSSSTSSDNDDDGYLVEKPNFNDKSFAYENPGSSLTDQTIDSNSNANLLDQVTSTSNSLECRRTTGSLPRSFNRRNKQSNRVSFPNFVATNIRCGRFSSLRRSHEDRTMEVEDTRRHTVDFSVLTSRKPYGETAYARLSETLAPKTFGSVRDELEKLSLD